MTGQVKLDVTGQSGRQKAKRIKRGRDKCVFLLIHPEAVKSEKCSHTQLSLGGVHGVNHSTDARAAGKHTYSSSVALLCATSAGGGGRGGGGGGKECRGEVQLRLSKGKTGVYSFVLISMREFSLSV